MPRLEHKMATVVPACDSVIRPAAMMRQVVTSSEWGARSSERKAPANRVLDFRGQLRHEFKGREKP